MADFFFFTEPDKLLPQTADQAFGPIDENQYRLGNMFSASSSPKAFAVTDGTVLVQNIDGVTDRVNIVLKPFNQPNIDLPKIDYIIYKGILKSSLIDSDIVADPSNNDLTSKIWESFSQLLEELDDGIEIPFADEVLGLGLTSTNTGNLQTLDTRPLNDAFFNHQFALFPVEAGDHIGDFSTTSLGLVIVYERIGFKATFKLARQEYPIFESNTLPESPTNALKFRLKHEKEEVLNFLDSTAFYGSFIKNGIYYKNENTSLKLDGDQLYDTLLSKHFNKNKIYLDFRNEYGDSFNYYENYTNTIYLKLSESTDFIEKNYYNLNWPIFSIHNDDFENDDTIKKIKIQFPLGDNEYPRVYIKKGYSSETEETESNQTGIKFLNFTTSEEMLTLDEALDTPKHSSSSEIISNYYQINYIKRYTTPDSTFNGYSLKKDSFLDNLFPIFDFNIPYTKPDKLDIKVYNEISFIDKSNINEDEFSISIGIAKDEELISFFTYPQHYNQNGANRVDLLPISSGQNNTGDNFLDYFNKKIVNQSIEKRTFTARDERIDYLSFAIKKQRNVEDLAVMLPDESINFDPPIAGKIYDFPNTEIISFTKEDYERLKIFKSTEFTEPYKVFLGLANTRFLLENNDSSAKTFFSLRGLKETSTGEIIPYEYITDIEVFAEDDLYNWDEGTETGRVLNAYWADVHGNPRTTIPYGDNTISIVIDIEDAIGKELSIAIQSESLFAIREVKPLKTLIISGIRTIYTFEFTPQIFGTNVSTIKEFSILIKIGQGEYKNFAIKETELLKVSAIRYIPSIMQSFGWNNAYRAQNQWFNALAENTPDVNVYTNFISIDWVLSFPRAKEKYDDLVATIWKSEESKRFLRREINRMIAFSSIPGNQIIAKEPSVENPMTPFGDFSFDLFEDSRIPLIEKFYYTGNNHSEPTFLILLGSLVGVDPSLDDLYGTLGNFNFRVAAKGFLSLEGSFNDEVFINVEKIGVYIRDSFDFKDSSLISQPLGFWNLLKKSISVRPIAEEEGEQFYINNEDYQNWRRLHNMGGDFRLYSDLKEIDVKDAEFKIPLLGELPPDN